MLHFILIFLSLGPSTEPVRVDSAEINTVYRLDKRGEIKLQYTQLILWRWCSDNTHHVADWTIVDDWTIEHRGTDRLIRWRKGDRHGVVITKDFRPPHVTAVDYERADLKVWRKGRRRGYWE